MEIPCVKELSFQLIAIEELRTVNNDMNKLVSKSFPVVSSDRTVALTDKLTIIS